MGQPAARVFDKVQHPLPGMLMPGPGSSNVLIGSIPAWRGLPAAAAAALQAAKAVSDAVVTAAEAAKTAAMGTPGAPAAIAAEQAAKAAATAAMTSLMNGLGAACAALGGTPDTHICATPGIPPPPHGPGMVIDGSPSVLINGLPACAVGDKVLEALGPPDPIIMGMNSVLVGKSGGGGMGLGALIAGAIAAFMNGLSSLAVAAKDLIKFVRSLIKAVRDAVIAKAVQIAKNLVKAVIRALDTFQDTFERAFATPAAPPKPPAPPKPSLDDVLKNYQVPADDKSILGTLISGVPLTDGEAMAVAKKTLALGPSEFKRKMMACKNDAFEAADAAYPMPDTWMPGETDQNKRALLWGNLGHNDAFRHTLWNARMTQEFGEEWTKEFASAHEGVPTNEDYREAQDLYNNEVGRRIAAENPNASPDELAVKVQEAMDNGDLIVVDKNKNIQWSKDVPAGEHYH